MRPPNPRNPARRAPEPIKPASPVGECPDWVHPEGRALWDRLVPQLAFAGMLRPADAQALTRYCDAWARWVEAARFIAANGEFFVIRNKAGQVTGFQNFPQTHQYHRYHKMLIQLERELGLTPAARARLHADGQEPSLPPGGVDELKRRLFFGYPDDRPSRGRGA